METRSGLSWLVVSNPSFWKDPTALPIDAPEPIGAEFLGSIQRALGPLIEGYAVGL